MSEGERRLSISFSGGETSAFMTQWLLKNARSHYDVIDVVFANTGQENEETLEFVEKCDKYFGLGVTWIEGVVHHGERKGSTHKIVNYESANRDGAVYEEYIRKYGVPNHAFPQCTRELKTNPLKSYRRSLGWGPGTYDTAIGIRNDEVDRVNSKYRESRLIYPLIPWSSWVHVPGGMTKPQINAFWRDMPFRLELKGYQGNCKWCWKKTLRKHLTLMKESPEIYDFPERMELLYRNVGPQDGERVFFRKNMDTKSLRELAKTAEFTPFHDDAQVYPDDEIEGVELDKSQGCSESCEVYTDSDEDSAEEDTD